MTSDLFEVDGRLHGQLRTSPWARAVSASAAASGEAVTINAEIGPARWRQGHRHRDGEMASSSLIPTQTVSNVAELTFPVMVVDTPLVVTLSADPMEIDEGGTSMITATANRAVDGW